MARTFKSFWKLCRREGVSLYIKGANAFAAKDPIKRREYPPGQHVYRRQKISEYGLKLRETQKLKRAYGLSDRQFDPLAVGFRINDGAPNASSVPPTATATTTSSMMPSITIHSPARRT